MSHFDLFIQIPRVIKHYRSCYVILYAFRLLVSFLPSILRQTSSLWINEFGHYYCTRCSRPSSDWFFCSREVYRTHVVRRIIAHVKSSDIAFHGLVSIVAFYMVNYIVLSMLMSWSCTCRDIYSQWNLYKQTFDIPTYLHRLVEIHLEFAHFDGD